MSTDVSIQVIQGIVSIASNIPIEEIIMQDRIISARKREKTVPRMVSMYLAKKYTNHSLGYIGSLHGGRDHATVLHAVKTVNNLLDTNNQETVTIYTRATKNIERIMTKRKKLSDNMRARSKLLPLKKKLIMVKSFIKNNVPLDQREFILNTYLIKCPYCNNDEYTAKALSRKVQKGYKRKL
jgi:hypothetical protein